ncbi:hypothetical protein SSP531S_37300 [Streptomyces spongiicola]|uniref:Uncharacterized protein n=1 Tax=Streptomyces spongiicola TaxID=1690221 RepID=A0A388T024_9ACTN|nr:hypothetical protein SSP531S_37300 [Streptomyces spongiicola]
MADEARVHEGGPLPGREPGQHVGRLAGAGGEAYVEAQRPQIALERRSGYRRTGEDGGRQTDSLLGADQTGGHGDSARDRAAACRLRLSDERKHEFTEVCR